MKKKGYRLSKRGRYVIYSVVSAFFIAIFSFIFTFINNSTEIINASSSNNNFQKPNDNEKDNTNITDNLLNEYVLSIYFKPGDTDLTIESISTLDLFVEVAKTQNYNNIRIEGNCATVHTNIISETDRQFNKKLSLERAQEVAKYLKDNGISEDDLTLMGNGSDRAINGNRTPAERKLNRRVDIIIEQPQNKNN